MEPPVEPLKCVRTAVEAGAAETDPPTACSEVAFIYGIGPGGVSPFECLLAGKRKEDAVSFHLGKAEIENFFGHLAAWFRPFWGGRSETFFRIRITGVETAEPREIIRAIAAATSHGHDGGCGCR